MDLALNDDQELLVASFGSLLEKHSVMDVVRAAEPLGHDIGLWQALRDIGAVDMGVPESSGGWGAELLDLALVAELLGRHCAPAPVIEAEVAARALARSGAAGAGRLAMILEGEAVPSLSLHPPIDGTARLVPAGAVADLVLVFDRDVLGLIETSESAHIPNHGCLPLADVAVGAIEPIAHGMAARAIFERALDEWLALTAATMVGVAAAALDVAAEYARERTAFGAPIGSYQGIAHRLADVVTAIDGAQLLAREAAWSCDRDSSDASELAAMAFAFAADTARDATQWAVHTLGGYGVMVEYDTQIYFRKARGLAGLFGGSSAAYRRVSELRRRGGVSVGL
jgi:alkylation response protein AidB-like acyl-CoA dehydrogenase